MDCKLLFFIFCELFFRFNCDPREFPEDWNFSPLVIERLRRDYFAHLEKCRKWLNFIKDQRIERCFLSFNLILFIYFRSDYFNSLKERSKLDIRVMKAYLAAIKVEKVILNCFV